MMPLAAAAGTQVPLEGGCCELGLHPDERAAAAAEGIPRGAPFECKPKSPPLADDVVELLAGMGRRSDSVRVSELPAIGQIALELSPLDLNFAAKRSHEFRDPGGEDSGDAV